MKIRRIVSFEGIYYIFYTAFDGANPAQSANTRVIMARTVDLSIFQKVGMVGPDAQDKDAMIFPERVRGHVVYIHRIVPNIQVAFFDDIDHLIQPEKSYWINHMNHLDKYTLMYPEKEWESTKIGAGPPPIRTDAGWLLVYHGVDRDQVYRAGAALLDENDPSRVIARLPYPILEPQAEYEKYGDVDMVVFPEGIVQWDNELLIYYGAADRVIALATGKLNHLIDELWRNKVL